MNKRHTELLAPAGSMESLRAAVRCGADAVYLGGQAFNARCGADNFSAGELADAAAYCHVRGVRVLLAVNTLVFDDEMGALDALLADACAAGVDAVIVQDLAVAAAVRERAPFLELHASTQMSVHNADGARMLERMGFRRVVLAREMSGEEICRVIEQTSLETECFVHGALCMSVSGQCALSAMIGGRSGNRGQCAQPCRLPFAADNSTHALSLRDLSLVEHIPALRQMGVAALKIEGRMKRPEYVAAATTACRRMLDGESVDYDTLGAIFSRGGFTDGYFTGRRGAAMFGTRRREDVVSAGPVLKKLQNLYKDERRCVPLELHLVAERDMPVRLTATDRDGHHAEAVGSPPQAALHTPTTEERARAALEKTGGTPYIIGVITAKIDEGLLIPASELNALRRGVLEEITRLRAARAMPPLASTAPVRPAPHTAAPRPYLRVRLHTPAQFSGALAASADELVLPLHVLESLHSGQLTEIQDKLLVEIPRIAFDDQELLEEKLQIVKNRGVQKALAGNLGAIGLAQRCGFAVHGDFGLNVTNTAALAGYEAQGLCGATLSIELELRRAKALGEGIPRGILAYGYLPLMALRNCPVRPAVGCKSCGRGFPALTDRLGNQFTVDCDWKAAALYNCVPLVLSDRLPETAGLDFLTLYFTRESAEECVHILELYRTGGDWPGAKTRGLYYRGVQ